LPSHGVVVEGVKEVKKAFQATRNVQNGAKNGAKNGLHLITLKMQKMLFFYFKVLNKTYSRDVT
jgi:hypothetical protein